MFRTKVVEKNTHPILNNFFFRKSSLLRHNVDKYFRVGQASDDNMTHVQGALET